MEIPSQVVTIEFVATGGPRLLSYFSLECLCVRRLYTLTITDYFNRLHHQFLKSGRTPVHYAVLGDPPKVDPSYEAVKILLDHGGEANEPDSVSGDFLIIHCSSSL